MITFIIIVIFTTIIITTTVVIIIIMVVIMKLFLFIIIIFIIIAFIYYYYYYYYYYYRHNYRKIIFANIHFLVINISAKTVHCLDEVSFRFLFSQFLICFNRIHATTTWCRRTTSILSYGII